MKRVFLTGVLAAAAALASAAAAGEPPSSKVPPIVGAFAAAHPTFPGVSVAVSRHGAIFQAAAGSAQLGARVPIVNGTFRVASVTKSFVAAATLRLVEEGRVELDAPVSRYLGATSLAILRKGGYDPAAIRVRHLLTHTSGLYDYAEDPGYQQYVLTHGRHRWTRAEQLRYAMEHGRPYGRPGSDFHYCDTGYILLGEILERVTHGGLGPALRSLLGFGRLEMRDTYLETLEPKPAPARQRLHQYFGTLDTTAFDPSFDLYGGGGLVSSAGDLARFYDGLFDGRVFRKAGTLRLMTGTPNPRSIGALGMGMFANTYAGEWCYGHDGFWGTTVVHCPKSGVTIAVAVNQAKGFDRPSQGLVARLLAAERSA